MSYFTKLYTTGEYSPGCFWTIFSCIRSYILVKTKICIKQYCLLRKLRKSLTVKHIKKKADTFTTKNMGRSLNDQFNDDDPKDLGKKVAISLFYYGLMRINEVKQLTLKDVKLNMTDDIEVDFPYTTKRSTRGYSFKVPSWLKPTFQIYLGRFPDKAPDNTPFLKNWTKCKDGKGRKLNMGINSIGGLSKLVATYLGK